MLQLVGFSEGSNLRYDLRKSGVEVEMAAGIVDVRNVMGARWDGIMYEGFNVRSVASRDRGSLDDGVKMSRVRAASIGARKRDVIAEDAVAIRTATIGEAAASIEAFGIAPEAVGISTSGSATPNVAARKLRMNDSSVRESIEYMNVEFVARHNEKGPLFADKDESASSKECGFLMFSRYGDCSGRLDPLSLPIDSSRCGLPRRPRAGEYLGSSSNGTDEVK
jgi:hypothetical protein